MSHGSSLLAAKRAWDFAGALVPVKSLTALAVTAVLLVSSSLFAQGAPTDDAFAQGIELQGRGDFAAALAAFQRARAKDPTPMAALHVAECEVATGRLVRAEQHLRALVAVHSTRKRAPH